MNSKGHFYCSLVKSILRILACLAIVTTVSFLSLGISVVIAAILFAVAEFLGIAEELLDLR